MADNETSKKIAPTDPAAPTADSTETEAQEAERKTARHMASRRAASHRV